MSASAYAAPATRAAPSANQIVVHAEEFNGILKRLTCDLAVRFPTDATIARAKKRVLLAIDVEPLAVINTAGPYLYDYREQIYAGDDQFFIENDYDAELKQSVDSEKADLTAYIIPRVKEAWGAAGEAEKASYLDTVQALLDAYVEYLAAKLL